MTALLAVGLLSPFYLNVTPEVRTTYVSLGKIFEDRPMQTTSIRGGLDTGTFGRFGVYNWDVSSLTDRRSEDHRHCLYHTEFGPTWSYDWAFADGWRLCNDLMCVWTLFRGWEKDSANDDYWWWQLSQSLENPYLVPYYRMRRYCSGSFYFWFETGVRRKFPLGERFYLTPSVFAAGGNDLNYNRVFGPNVNGGDWGGGGVSSVTFRLEAGWQVETWMTVFAFVEQYEVVGHDARDTNARSASPYAHNDWTLGGVGIRFRF